MRHLRALHLAAEDIGHLKPALLRGKLQDRLAPVRAEHSRDGAPKLRIPNGHPRRVLIDYQCGEIRRQRQL